MEVAGVNGRPFEGIGRRNPAGGTAFVRAAIGLGAGGAHVDENWRFVLEV